MRLHRLVLVAGAVVLMGVPVLGVPGFALYLWRTAPPTPGVTLENFRRLRVGMSVRDVEALLGPFEVSESWGVLDGKDKDFAIHLQFAWVESDKLIQGFVRAKDDSIIAERLHTDDDYSFLHQWLTSDAYAIQHAYFMFAIAVGVLALLLSLYLKRRKLSSSPK